MGLVDEIGAAPSFSKSPTGHCQQVRPNLLRCRLNLQCQITSSFFLWIRWMSPCVLWNNCALTTTGRSDQDLMFRPSESMASVVDVQALWHVFE